MKNVTLFFLFTLLDQCTKYLATKDLLPDWGGLLVYTCNPNIAWGLTLPTMVFYLSWTAALALLVYLFYTHRSNLFLGLAILGALLNMLDRAVYGCVVDFIKLGNFPIFNIADILITLGITLFLVRTYILPASWSHHRQ